jgi:hypothetical protein
MGIEGKIRSEDGRDEDGWERNGILGRKIDQRKKRTEEYK